MVAPGSNLYRISLIYDGNKWDTADCNRIVNPNAIQTDKQTDVEIDTVPCTPKR